MSDSDDNSGPNSGPNDDDGDDENKNDGNNGGEENHSSVDYSYNDGGRRTRHRSYDDDHDYDGNGNGGDGAFRVNIDLSSPPLPQRADRVHSQVATQKAQPRQVLYGGVSHTLTSY
jgi:hypothetical protein